MSALPSLSTASALFVVGVDLAAGRGVTAVATLALAADLAQPPRYEPTLSGHPTSDDALLALCLRAQPRVLALDAPLSLPHLVAQALIPNSSTPASSTPADPAASPYTRAAERDPIWSALGVRPFPVSFLGGLTFRAIALLPRLRALLPDTAIIEAFPSGAAASLGLRPTASPLLPPPAPAQPPVSTRARRAPKTSVTARWALQTALRPLIAALPALPPTPPDADNPSLLGADQLDALLAALTAVAYLRDQTYSAGDPQEGSIILPRPPA